MRRVQWREIRTKFLLVHRYRRYEKTRWPLPSDFGKIINETMENPGVPSLIKRAIKTHSTYGRFVVSFYRPEVTRAERF